MGKTDFLEKLKAKSGLASKEKAKEFLDVVLSVMTENLVHREMVSFTGFGNFKVVIRGERKGRNPRTGEPCVVPEAPVVKFTQGKLLKLALKEN